MADRYSLNALAAQERKASVIAMVTGGASYIEACRAVGVSRDCGQRWVREGAREYDAVFAEAVLAADALAVSKAEQLVYEAGKKDWRAAHAWLQHKRPQDWTDAAAMERITRKTLASLGIDAATTAEEPTERPKGLKLLT